MQTAEARVRDALERLRQLLDEGALPMTERVVDEICRVDVGEGVPRTPASPTLKEMLSELESLRALIKSGLRATRAGRLSRSAARKTRTP